MIFAIRVSKGIIQEQIDYVMPHKPLSEHDEDD